MDRLRNPQTPRIGRNATERSRPILAVSAQQVSHLETGRRSLRVEQARRLDDLWDTDRLFEKLWTHAQREHDRDWFRKFAAYERRAQVIRLWQPLVIPGLFQTAEYALALFEAGQAPDVDGAITARMERQQILERSTPPYVWAVVGENAVRERVGSRDVFQAQLSRLLEIINHPHVTVQVIPAGSGAHVGLDGGFTLLKVSDGPLAFVEAQLTGRLVRDGGEVETLEVWFDRIRAKAMSEDDSLKLVASIMENL